MAIDDLMISTGVDSLIKLVHERGRVELASAAKELSLPPQNVSDWAGVLEQEGIIKIEYKLTKAYLIWVPQEPASIDQRSEQIAVKKSAVGAEIGELEKRVGEHASEIESLHSEYGSLLGMMDGSLNALNEKLSSLSELDRRGGELYSQELARISRLKGELAALEGRLSAAETAGKRQKSPPPQIAIDRSQIEELARFRDDIQGLISQSESIYADIDAKIGAAEEQLRAEHAKRGNLLDARLDSLSEKLSHLDAKIEALSQEQRELYEEAGKMAEESSASPQPPESLSESLEQLKALEAEAKGQKKKLERELGGTAASVSRLLAKFESAYRAQQAAGGAGAAPLGADSGTAKLAALKEEISASQKRLAQFAAELESTAAPLHADVRRELEAGRAMLLRLEAAQGRQGQMSLIMDSIGQLRARQQALSLKLRALEGEAAVISLESSGPQVKAIEQKLALTTDEERDFERKREELRVLIRKMWEEEKK